MKKETKKCTTCGEDLPATKRYFDYAPRSIDGLTNDCSACRSCAIKTPTIPAPAKKKVKLKPGAERKILAINLESEPELWPALAERASAEMRTPVAQALWILKEELI